MCLLFTYKIRKPLYAPFSFPKYFYTVLAFISVKIAMFFLIILAIWIIPNLNHADRVNYKNGKLAGNTIRVAVPGGGVPHLNMKVKCVK